MREKSCGKCAKIKSFLVQIATEEENLVCHFFHGDFERCRILDKHLRVLAPKYFGTRFIKLSAPVSLP